MIERLTFRPLEMADLPKLRDWLSRPHWTQWWGPPDALEVVKKDYGAWIADPSQVQPLIALLNGKPLGYIQSYIALGSGGGAILCHSYYFYSRARLVVEPRL